MNEQAQKLIVALDLPDPARAEELVSELAPLGVSFKIGLELFMAGGPAMVAKLAPRFNLFLDLKFHDIPNTVAAAVKGAAELGVWMLNIHAAGGRDMMLAAREAAQSAEHKPLLMAVTVLTSMNNDMMAETGIMPGIPEQVSVLSKLAARCGLDGVICSPLEIAVVKQAVSPQFLTVTPGIRPFGEVKDDQFRVAVPAKVIRSGGDYLVVGRPITGSGDPSGATQKILAEMGEVT